MAQPPVLIASFGSDSEAQLARGRLEVEGIPAAVSASPLRGSFELLVPADLAHEAVDPRLRERAR